MPRVPISDMSYDERDTYLDHRDMYGFETPASELDEFDVDYYETLDARERREQQIDRMIRELQGSPLGAY